MQGSQRHRFGPRFCMRIGTCWHPSTSPLSNCGPKGEIYLVAAAITQNVCSLGTLHEIDQKRSAFEDDLLWRGFTTTSHNFLSGLTADECHDVLSTASCTQRTIGDEVRFKDRFRIWILRATVYASSFRCTSPAGKALFSDLPCWSLAPQKPTPMNATVAKILWDRLFRNLVRRQAYELICGELEFAKV